MSVDPLRVTHQGIRDIGVDDGHILAVDGGRVLALQLGHDLLHDLNGELAGGIQTSPGSYLVAVRLGAVGNIGTGLQDIAGHGVQSQTSLTAQNLGGLHDGVVDGGQLQNIGLGDVVAVLRHSGGDGGYIQALAVRGHAFSQRSGSLGQRGELTELDGLATVLGDGALLGELVVNQSGLCLIQQGHVVEGLVFCGQAIQKSGLHHVGKHLQVDHHDIEHSIISFHRKRMRR